jgi:hypothetical protein
LSPDGSFLGCFETHTGFRVLEPNTGKTLSVSQGVLATFSTQTNAAHVWEPSGGYRFETLPDGRVLATGAYHHSIADLKRISLMSPLFVCSDQSVLRVGVRGDKLLRFLPDGSPPEYIYDLGKKAGMIWLISEQNGILLLNGAGSMFRCSITRDFPPEELSDKPLGGIWRKLDDSRIAVADRSGFMVVSDSKTVTRKELECPKVGFLTNDGKYVVGYSTKGDKFQPELEVVAVEEPSKRFLMKWKEVGDIQSGCWDDQLKRLYVCNAAGTVACFEVVLE